MPVRVGFHITPPAPLVLELLLARLGRFDKKSIVCDREPGVPGIALATGESARDTADTCPHRAWG